MISQGIDAIYVDTDNFQVVGNLTDAFIDGRKVKADCNEDGLKFGIVKESTWIETSGGQYVTNVLLYGDDSDDLTNKISSVWYEEMPHMADGRLIIRPDTRPLNTQQYFTCGGDSSEDIGDGNELRWDFSNDDDLYTGSEVPSGYKAKELKIQFKCKVHLKDGSLYFFDAPWGQYVHMDIVVPAGNYYPNPAGTIPASALGLTGKTMYAYATADTLYQKYVNKHFMYKDCPMGDELNAEGCAVDGLPIGWYIRGLVITPESDIISKGYASLEMYRCHTNYLPGMTSLH